MHDFRELRCSICGHSKRTGEIWFLLVENRWEDKLRVLHWDDLLATQLGVHHTCSCSHLEELVVHWMVTGRIDYPFAQLALGSSGGLELRNLPDSVTKEVDTRGARYIARACNG